MLKLHDIFLRRFSALFLSIFFILGILIYIWMKDIYLEQSKTDLLNNINILSLSLNGKDDLDKKVKSVKELIGLRTTIINENGVVIAESHKDASLMDNHINRSEIIQSKYQEFGSIIRYSATLEKDLLYVSKKFYLDEKDIYIRMARDIERINEHFFYLSLKVGVLILFFLLLAFYISLKISKDVRDETKKILQFLKSLSKQNKPIKIQSNYSDEFQKITKLLSDVSLSLSKRDKIKSKYTAKLKLSNRQKDDIISAISHEFKNPIAVISGYTQTLLGDEDINPTIREKFLNKISSNSLKLTHMIDRLRLSIKLDESKAKYEFTSCNIEQITRSIVEDLLLTYPSRQIEINAKNIIIQADETMINVAITNLIENALKYSQDTIYVDISSKSIAVKDSGLGINENEILKITDKFYRVSSNSWNNSLGVGLSLVKNIVNLHKFTLNIKSVEDEYSIFEIVYK